MVDCSRLFFTLTLPNNRRFSRISEDRGDRVQSDSSSLSSEWSYMFTGFSVISQVEREVEKKKELSPFLRRILTILVGASIEIPAAEERNNSVSRYCS